MGGGDDRMSHPVNYSLLAAGEPLPQHAITDPIAVPVPPPPSPEVPGYFHKHPMHHDFVSPLEFFVRSGAYSLSIAAIGKQEFRWKQQRRRFSTDRQRGQHQVPCNGRFVHVTSGHFARPLQSIVRNTDHGRQRPGFPCTQFGHQLGHFGGQ